MRLLLIFLLFLPFFVHAQNLLMNESFEEENICTEYDKNCAPEGWISTSLYADYYFDDEPHSYDGKRFTGLILARKEKPQLRNFLRSRLLCGLRKGAQYKLEFYFRSNHQISDSVGVYFSATDFLFQKERIMNSRPQLFINADSLKKTNEWQKVVLVYTATGAENFINIGDFKTRGHEFKKGYPDINNSFYFFLDKISLKPLNKAEKLCSQSKIVEKDEYDFNVRHDKLDRLIYTYTKSPPLVIPLSKTVVQRIDTFVIPDVLFATNSYSLSSKAFSILDSFITSASNLPVDSLVVEGHTDNLGSVALNKKLSENRASSVAAYLADHFKCPLLIRGWASEKAVAENRTSIGRQKNRRVEIYIYVRE